MLTVYGMSVFVYIYSVLTQANPCHLSYMVLANPALSVRHVYIKVCLYGCIYANQLLMVFAGKTQCMLWWWRRWPPLWHWWVQCVFWSLGRNTRNCLEVRIAKLLLSDKLHFRLTLFPPPHLQCLNEMFFCNDKWNLSLTITWQVWGETCWQGPCQ